MKLDKTRKILPPRFVNGRVKVWLVCHGIPCILYGYTGVYTEERMWRLRNASNFIQTGCEMEELSRTVAWLRDRHTGKPDFWQIPG